MNEPRSITWINPFYRSFVNSRIFSKSWKIHNSDLEFFKIPELYLLIQKQKTVKAGFLFWRGLRERSRITDRSFLVTGEPLVVSLAENGSERSLAPQLHLIMRHLANINLKIFIIISKLSFVVGEVNIYKNSSTSSPIFWHYNPVIIWIHFNALPS